MSKVTIKEWYKRVNDTWPKEGPVLSAEEANLETRKADETNNGE